jgi:hypothetical protein
LTRALAVTLIALSVVLTAVTIWSNLTVRTTVGPAHFWAEFSRLIAFSSWLVLAMLWCTHRVVESNKGGWKEVGRKVVAKVDKLETHLDESIAEVRDEVGDRLDGVEGVIGEIDKDRVQANAVVLQLFREKRAR